MLGVGTTRTGWVGALRADGLVLRRVGEPDARPRDLRRHGDLLVAYVPGRRLPLGHGALSRRCPLGCSAGSRSAARSGAGITYVGPRPLPVRRSAASDIFTIDASASARLGATSRFGSSPTNLLDTQYRLGEYNYASDFHSQPQPTLVPERTFTAGAPRGLFATFAINFGGV